MVSQDSLTSRVDGSREKAKVPTAREDVEGEKPKTGGADPRDPISMKS